MFYLASGDLQLEFSISLTQGYKIGTTRAPNSGTVDQSGSSLVTEYKEKTELGWGSPISISHAMCISILTFSTKL